MTDRARWAIVTGALFATLALVIWLVTTESPFIHWMIRLYQDKHFLKETVRSWGWMAPLVFIAIQALQVIISLRSEEHTSELQSPCNLVCRLLLEKKKHE